ncbi:unnamed protein product [Porites lobata]|uniref:Coiled-coil domain-containing protein 86 n=1 Tax=Porites lobata TaxID=104759 RepID=A0ABN8NNE1_9CNID|nr:unnamed protein product [Porites lobata]
MAATTTQDIREGKPKTIPKGRPKSGRVWKSEKKRKSAVIGVHPLHTSWGRKQQVRMQQKLMKVYEKELKEEAKKQKEEKRRKIEERKKRREENEKKSQVVQVIKDTAKIKRMKKKQLRKIETR